jgi:rubredoxin
MMLAMNADIRKPDKGGSDSRVQDAARLECRICWYVYDPAQGDEVEQVPAGTPFSQLSDHWRCPQCDAGKDMFLPLDD